MALVPDALAQDVLVETAGEVALQQPVVVDCLGHHAAHKLEVAKMVGIAVGRGVDGVGDAVARRGAEQGVHGVEHLPGDDHVPLPEQAAGVLALLPFKHYVPGGEEEAIGGVQSTGGGWKEKDKTALRH